MIFSTEVGTRSDELRRFSTAITTLKDGKQRRLDVVRKGKRVCNLPIGCLNSNGGRAEFDSLDCILDLKKAAFR